MALLRLILWLIHAVLAAFASALTDVFRNLTAALAALLVVALVSAGVASAFGVGGFNLLQRWRKRQ